LKPLRTAGILSIARKVRLLFAFWHPSAAFVLILSAAVICIILLATREPILPNTELKPRLVGRLTRLEGRGQFRLSMKNVSHAAIATLPWSFFYEVRLLDDSGVQISDEKDWEQLVDLARPTKDDFLILRPGQSTSIDIRSHDWRIESHLGPEPRFADCIERVRHSGPLGRPFGVDPMIATEYVAKTDRIVLLK